MGGTRIDVGQGGSPALSAPELASRMRDYFALVKPRPMSIVLAAAAAGYLAAPAALDPLHAVLALTAIAAGGGGSAALNMWYERDLDRVMARTAGRPLVAGRIEPSHALVFALMLCLAGVTLMAGVAGAAAAGMLALTIAFYGVVYTMWLKRTSALNVVLGGGIASVLTPLTGWAAASGTVSLDALALFAFLLPWTPPHVWSQAIVRRADYARASVPMMPVVAGVAATTRLIGLFTLAHVAASLLPVAIGSAGAVYGAVAVIGGGLLTIEAVRLWRLEDGAALVRQAWRFYRRSILYVVVMLVTLVLERALVGVAS